jgi:hypothetical protein
MDAAWSTVPIFADSHGGHQFFITSGGGSTAPPTENDFLDTADAAMIADLEAAWADFNAAITTFSAAAQNTPPPPPPATDSRGFWRIKADWSLDSDSDGILDHAEFALAAAQAAAGDGLVGNPHNADTNNDGIPDGEQLDSDGDSIPDALDVAPDDGLVAYEIVALPRYAMFTVADSPHHTFAINDRGTALALLGYWKGGVTHNLITDEQQIPGYPLSEANEGADIHARAINDNDQIIGAGIADLEDPLVGANRRRIYPIIYWSVPQAVPAVVASTAGTTITYSNRTHLGNYYAGRHLDNSGSFFSPAVTWDLTRPAPGPKHEDDGWKKWTLPPGGGPIVHAPAPEATKGTAAGGIVWGSTYGENGEWLHSDITSPFSAEIPVTDPENVIAQGASGNILAFNRYAGMPAMVRKGEEWGVSPLLADVRDIADNGTAIRKNAYFGEPLDRVILLNGKWTSLARAIPGIPERWKTTTAAWLSDTSPGGWILAHDRAVPRVAAALLPLRVTGRYTNSANKIVEEAAGVDDFSIGSSDPAASLDGIDHVQDRIWVMAPAISGETTITIDTPVHSSAPVWITATGIRLNGNAMHQLTSEPTPIAVE